MLTPNPSWGKGGRLALASSCLAPCPRSRLLWLKGGKRGGRGMGRGQRFCPTSRAPAHEAAPSAAARPDFPAQPDRGHLQRGSGPGGTWWGRGQPVGGWDRPLGTLTLPPAAPSPCSPQPLLAFILSQLLDPGSAQGEERVETVLGAMGGLWGPVCLPPATCQGAPCSAGMETGPGPWAQCGTWPKRLAPNVCFLQGKQLFGGTFLWWDVPLVCFSLRSWSGGNSALQTLGTKAIRRVTHWGWSCWKHAGEKNLGNP